MSKDLAAAIEHLGRSAVNKPHSHMLWKETRDQAMQVASWRQKTERHHSTWASADPDKEIPFVHKSEVIILATKFINPPGREVPSKLQSHLATAGMSFHYDKTQQPSDFWEGAEFDSDAWRQARMMDPPRGTSATRPSPEETDQAANALRVLIDEEERIGSTLWDVPIPGRQTKKDHQTSQSADSPTTTGRIQQLDSEAVTSQRSTSHPTDPGRSSPAMELVQASSQHSISNPAQSGQVSILMEQPQDEAQMREGNCVLRQISNLKEIMSPIPAALGKVTDVSTEILAQLSEILETLAKLTKRGDSDPVVSGQILQSLGQIHESLGQIIATFGEIKGETSNIQAVLGQVLAALGNLDAGTMPDQEGVHSNGAPNLPATTESAQGTKNAPQQEPERAAESSREQ
ncbi:hypothetical protein VTJ04DRAFT_10389 [Mycothermus thermophilus]|uniref:uncharacterized protein n=1 Tax=Humicola insolens TaxID=85995 RepID=UPI0037449D48